MKTTSNIISRKLPGEIGRRSVGVLDPEVAHHLPSLIVTEPPEPETIHEALRQGRTITLPRPAVESALEGRDPARGRAVLKALDHLDIGLFLVNRQGYVTDCNEAGSELLGIDHTTAWENRHVSNLSAVFPGDVYEQFDRLLSGDRSSMRREIAIGGAGGRPLAVTLCAVPLADESATEVVGLVRESHPEQARRTHEELSILAEVAAALSSSLELKQILRVILTGATASQGLGFNRAFLFLYDCDRHELTAHMAVGPTSGEEAGRIWTHLAGMQLSLAQLLDVHPNGTEDATDQLFDRIKGLTLPLENGSLLTQICDSGAGVHLEPGTDLDDLTAALLARTGTTKAALVPLMSKGNCQGLVVADNAITGAPIGDDAVRLLKVLADQAAVAIQRARLHDRERQRTRELERTHRRLEESQEQIIRAEKMSVMGELTSAVAQELRNPLTIIEGFTNILRESMPGECGCEYVNIIASEVRRADALLRQVIEFASASRRQNQVFDFSILTANTIDRIRGQYERESPDLNLSTATEKLAVLGNPDQLGNALYQLLQLVVEETSDEARIETRTERHGDQARLAMTFHTRPERAERLMRTLDQMFARQTSALRLQVLVAGETIKYHGGDYRLTATDTGAPLLVLELPLANQGVNPV